MASTTSQENLEERMERIRKTNEQIEKKHREAEEDRILALKANAMISTKPPDESSWPKAHAYDEVEFKYEIENSEELEGECGLNLSFTEFNPIFFFRLFS
jgi:hypothetical protein